EGIDLDTGYPFAEDQSRFEISGTGDSSRPAAVSARNDAERSAVGTQLNTPADLDATQTGTMIARSGQYDAPLRKTEDGTWFSAASGKEISTEDLTEEGGAWDVVSPAVVGVLLEDDEAFADA